MSYIEIDRDRYGRVVARVFLPDGREVNRLLIEQEAAENYCSDWRVKMAKITGIGGVFFKARKDKEELAVWYQKNLGVKFEDSGAVELKWKEDTAEDNGFTHWCIAEQDSAWFSPSSASFMINYRVDDLEGMILQLKEAGTDLFEGPELHENGVFAWILDPDGNKIELWEPKIWDEKNKDK